MADPQDQVEITGISTDSGVRSVSLSQAKASMSGRPWLGIVFNCCKCYGRMYRNAEGTAYQGRCPRCGVPVRASIGPGGTSQRIFETT